MILLDTNVISEMMRARPEPKVEAWLAAQPSGGLFITTINEAELRFGVAILPDGRRRKMLAASLEAMLANEFLDRILPFDSSAAVTFAIIAAERRRAGRPIAEFDVQIAAIARSRGASLATRNTADFEGCGIAVIDPWK